MTAPSTLQERARIAADSGRVEWSRVGNGGMARNFYIDGYLDGAAAETRAAVIAELEALQEFWQQHGSVAPRLNSRIAQLRAEHPQPDETKGESSGG